MKKCLLSTVFLIMTLAACNNADEFDTPSTPQESQSANLSIEISGSAQTQGISLKSSGTPSAEDKILKLDAFIFNADGSLDGSKEVLSTSGNTITSISNIPVSSGNKKVFVVANYQGDAALISSLEDLYGAVADLRNEKDNGYLTMVTPLIDTEIKPGKNYIGYNASEEISSNTIYKLSITIKDLGTNNVYDALAPSSLYAKIGVQDWSLTVNKEVVFD